MAKPAYVYLWEFLVAPGQAAAFERAYGPEGDWARLFRRAPGYLRTELHRDLADPLRFVTVDYWESRAAWEEFRSCFAADFAALDASCESFTRRETEIGRFQPVG